MEPHGHVGGAVIDEELCTNTAEELVESCQAKECAQLGSPTAEITLASENKQLAGFNMLRFKDSFFEVVEELRFRRAQDSENLKRIQELLSEKHKLIQKLDEVEKRCESLVEENKVQLLECTKKHEEEVRQYSNDQIKMNIARESREKELKMLKDEMRALHLANHNLEKRVQELERQLQLQNSSREGHLNKMAQLEEKCGQLSCLAEQVKDQIERLEMNVKQSRDLQQRLDYVNQHQKCEITQLQTQVDSCNQELVHLRAHAHNDRITKADNEHVAKLKSIEQDLKMQTDLCKHSQDELTSLRLEHQKVLQQLREAHDLLEKQVETCKKLLEKEEQLKEELDSLKLDIEKLTSDLIRCRDSSESQKEENVKVIEKLESELLDTKQRLKTLQADFQALQESYESLEISKKSLISQNELQIENLDSHNKQLEVKQAELITDNSTLKERSQVTSKQIESCQSALDQSEVELTQLRATILERDRLIAKLEANKITVAMNQPGLIHHQGLGGQVDATAYAPAPSTSVEASALAEKEGSRNITDQCQPPLMKERTLEEHSEFDVQSPPHKKSKLDLRDENNKRAIQGVLESTSGDIGNSNEHQQDRIVGSNVIKIEDSPLVPNCEKIEKVELIKTEMNEKSSKASVSEECIREDNRLLLPRKNNFKGSVASPVTNKIEEGSRFEFSPEEHSRLMSTQMNRQIGRVEKFLRTDRLRRKRDPLTFQID